MNNYSIMIAGIAKAGMEEYVKRYMTQIMEHSRNDPGCLIYNVHQSTENPAEFMVYMLWEKQEDFENHNKKPEMQKFKKELAKQLFEQESPKTYWNVIK